jgi:hypothetical protein
VVGAPFFDTGQPEAGLVRLLYGKPSPFDWWNPEYQDFEANQTEAHFGYSVGTAGDVNGDGYSDIIVGAPDYDDGEIDDGRASIFLGSPSGVRPGPPAWSVHGNQPYAHLGLSVGAAGDVNGDGFSDVIAGAYMFDRGQEDEGAAFVYHGSLTGPGPEPNWMAESDQGGAYFGNSVGTAGDVNRDGYSDVIIGAYAYDHGQKDEGAAFLWLGSSDGLVAPGTPENADWMGESDQADARYGISVGTAGDVNGDGLADILVGADAFDNVETDEGRAFLYYGSFVAISPSADWTAESNLYGAAYGISVGTAGDVNGDGYADVIVGAYRYSNGESLEGAAFVYHGSPAGLPGVPGSNDYDWITESGLADTFYGVSVASAGDLTGDGYSDVIVGAHHYGPDNVGRAFVYCGDYGRGMGLMPRQCRVRFPNIPIAHLGNSDDPDGFRVEMLGRTPFGRGKVRLECEVMLLDLPFIGTGTVISPYWRDTGVGGARLDQVLNELSANTVVHWRARLRYHSVTTPFLPTHSRWITIPWNGWQEADLRQPLVPLVTRTRSFTEYE